MRFTIILFALLAVFAANAAPPAGYYLVWADEFTGSSLDTTKWNYWLAGARRDAVNVSSAVAVGGGNLTITTFTTNGTHYTGMIATDNKFRTKFGYWEASIDWNDAPGMWSAYWMQSPTMGADLSDPVTSGSEIDIAEHRAIDSASNNIANRVQANIHWNGYGAAHQSQGSGNVGSGLATGFHTYGFKWTSGGYDFTIDGASKWTGGSSPVSRSTEWMILSSEVEDGSWAGSIPAGGYGNLLTSTTKLTVDYVRYYAPTSTVFWKGTASAYWTNAANWVSNMIPATVGDVTFSYLSTANRSNILGANFTVDSLTVLETTAPFSLNGTNSLTLGAGGVDMISLAQNAAFNCPIVMGAAQTWTIGGSRTLTVNSSLSGAGLLTKAGTGTLLVGVSNVIAKTILATGGFVGVNPGATNQLGLSASGNGGVKAVVGASPGRCTTLSLTNASLNFEFGTVTGMPGVGLVAAALNLSGTNDVNITGLDLPITNITLMTYSTKVGGGSFKLGTLPAGAAATLTDTGAALVLNVTVWPQVLTWHGAATGTWNTNGASLDWDGGAKAYREYTGTADSVVFDDAAVDFSVTLSQALSPAAVTVDNDTNAYTFNPPGKISGATTLVKRGSNTLTLNTTNDFTGNLTINEGRVVVGATGGLYQFVSGTRITINSGGTLSLQGNIGWQSRALGWLDVQEGGLVLNGGTLQHTGNSNAKSSDGAGHLFTIGAAGATLDSATAGQTFSVGYRYDYGSVLASSSGGSLLLTGAGDGDLNYAFPGSGSLIKSGSGKWQLTTNNSFTGTTTVEAGVLNIQTSGALGGTAGGTTVAGNARLELEGGITVTGEALTISGSGGAAFYNGALHSASGSNTWTGNVTLEADNTRIGAAAGATLVVSGVIGDGVETNGLVVRSADDTGTVVLSGANTYAGATTVIAGVLRLGGGNNRLPVGTTLLLGGVGNVLFDLNGRSQQVVGLSTNGVTPSVVTNSSVTLAALTVSNSPGAPTTYTGRLLGNVALTKSGAEALRLTGTNAHTGVTLINGGALVLNGALGGSAVTVTNTGTLAGIGVLSGPVTNQPGGTLAPGDYGIGRLTISNSLTLRPGGTTAMELNKSSATNDSVLVTGAVSYGGTLNVTNLGGALAAGDQFVLFSVVGAKTGSFSNLVVNPPLVGLAASFNPTNGTLSFAASYATTPTNLNFSLSGNTLTLSWPTSHLGWILQSQTNALAVGLGTNWQDVAGSSAVTANNISVSPAIPSRFFRLRRP